MTLQEIVQSATVEQPTHSHALVALWVLAALVLAEAVAIALMLRARGGWGYVATIPITNLRSITAIGLMVATVIGTGLVGYFAGVWPPDHVFTPTLTAITVWSGIEVTGVWLKRVTTDPSLPSTQNMMAAQAASGVAVDARDARVAAAPQARQPIPGEAAAVTLPLTPRPDLGVPDRGVL